MSNRKYWY